MILCTTGLNKHFQDVSEAGVSSCQMDHRQGDWDQDAENSQSESDEAGAGPLPAQGTVTLGPAAWAR